MSTALTVFLLLFLLRVQSVDLSHARSFSTLSEFDLPEIDGSAVDTCRIFPDSVPDTTTTTTTTTTPITRKVVATTRRPAVQTPPRKPETKSSQTPIRPQPAPSGPITDSHSNAARLLYYLLANSRRNVGSPLQRFNRFMSQQTDRLMQSTSESDETAAALLKRARQTDANRWKITSFSSENSSDES